MQDCQKAATRRRSRNAWAQSWSARHDAGLTQLELARRSGIQQAAISKVERGLGNPTFALIETLAHSLGVKLDITVSKDMEAG